MGNACKINYYPAPEVTKAERKDMELRFDEVMNGLNTILNTNEYSAKAAVGMLIDMVCARYGEDPVEFAERVADAVKTINEDMGAYEDEPDDMLSDMFENPLDELDELFAIR